MPRINECLDAMTNQELTDAFNASFFGPEPEPTVPFEPATLRILGGWTGRCPTCGRDAAWVLVRGIWREV